MAQTQFAYNTESPSFNDILTSSLRKSTYSSIANYLGENEFTVSGAIPVLLPALCSFLDSNEPQSRDLGKLSTLIIHYRESLGNFNLNNIEPSSFSTLTDIGTNDLIELFGTKLSALLDNISLVSGLKEESVFTLLALLTPYLLKQVGTSIPKGPAFTSSLLTLIDENKETFQDLIKQAKPKLIVSKPIKKEGINLFPYFIIITLSAFFTFSGFNYFSRNPDNFSVSYSKTLNSIAGFERSVRGKLGLIKPPKSVSVKEPGAISNHNVTDNRPTKEPTLAEAPRDQKIELQFDPTALSHGATSPIAPARSTLNEELDSFASDSSGIKLRTFILDKIKFGFGESILPEEAKDQLLEIIPVLRTIEDLHIEVAGHTDNTGNEEVNKKISKERAEAVASVFVQNGIAPANIHILGYGSSRPISTNSTLEGRYVNRRIELLLVKK